MSNTTTKGQNAMTDTRTKVSNLVQQLRMNTPEQVRNCRFCCWKLVPSNGKPRKLSFNPRTGMLAKTDDPETFASFEEALKALETGRYSGIGILVGNGVAAFDIDHCVDDYGCLNSLAASVLGLLKNCYVELSPSGSGLRGFFSVPSGYTYDKNIYYIKHGDLELYLPGMTNRFVTLTGNVFREGNVCDESNALQVVLETLMKRKTAVAETSEDFEPHSYLTDEEALAKVRNHKKFTDCFDGNWTDYFPSQSEADLYVLGLLAFYCGGDMDQMERIFCASALMRDKFRNSTGVTAYGINTMKRAVVGRRCFYDPEYGRTRAEDDFSEIEEDADLEEIWYDSETRSALDQRLESLLASNPGITDLYSKDGILLAAYAKIERPADYEKLREQAKKNDMSVRRYEKEIKAKEEAIRKYREEQEAQKRAEIEQVIQAIYPPFIVYNKRTKSTTVDPTKLAIYVGEHLQYILVEDSLRDTRTKYVYEDGVYTICSDEKFKGYIKQFIEDYDPTLVKMKDVEEANRNLSAGLNAVPYDRLNKDESIVNFRNGILDLNTMELKPHNPNNLSTIQLDCDWIETDEPTPTFDNYLADLSDYSEDIRALLLQFMGAVLSNIRGSRYKKALFLAGEGDTGKSQLKVLTERILGRDNFAAIDLPEMESQFGSSMLYGKRLAGTSDMTFMTIRELKTFKTVTGGDHIKVEFKGKNAFSYIYNGFLWFCMNKPPKFGGDDGTWVYDRIMLVHCPNVIPKAEQDHDLLEKMYAERNGIVRKAILALKTSIANGYRFTEPEAITSARAEYRRNNDSVAMFIEDCMVKRDKSGSIPKDDYVTVEMVVRIYRKWCQYNNNGYAKTKKEFILSYCDYVGMVKDTAIVRRGRGCFFTDYRVTVEAFEYLLPTDMELHRGLAAPLRA